MAEEPLRPASDMQLSGLTIIAWRTSPEVSQGIVPSQKVGSFLRGVPPLKIKEQVSAIVPSCQSSGITAPNGSKFTNHDLKMAFAICSK